MNTNFKMICSALAGFMIGGITFVCANQVIQATQNDQIKITLNGEIQVFKDETSGAIQYPITYDNRTFLPLRTVANLVGVNVDYDSTTNTAILTTKDYISSTPTKDNNTQSISLGQKNALEKAKSYLRISPFSKQGLLHQLEFEGFSTEEASYGVENCEADWNEQASKKAESYLKISSFSKQGLIEQLEFEGFTKEQAEYGVTSIGY